MRQKRTKAELYRTVFDVADQEIRKRRLYLKANLTLTGLAKELNVNRTYLSRAICRCAGGFRAYINKLRVDYVMSALGDVKRDDRFLDDGEEVAFYAGFQNKRSMDRIFEAFTGRKYNEEKKRIRSRMRK